MLYLMHIYSFTCISWLDGALLAGEMHFCGTAKEPLSKASRNQILKVPVQRMLPLFPASFLYVHVLKDCKNSHCGTTRIFSVSCSEKNILNKYNQQFKGHSRIFIFKKKKTCCFKR